MLCTIVYVKWDLNFRFKKKSIDLVVCVIRYSLLVAKSLYINLLKFNAIFQQPLLIIYPTFPQYLLPNCVVDKMICRHTTISLELLEGELLEGELLEGELLEGEVC